MPKRFVFSGTFETANMTPEQEEVFKEEVKELLAQSLMYVQKWGRDSEHGPIEASVHNVRTSIT